MQQISSSISGLVEWFLTVPPPTRTVLAQLTHTAPHLEFTRLSKSSLNRKSHKFSVLPVDILEEISSYNDENEEMVEEQSYNTSKTSHERFENQDEWISKALQHN